MEAGKPNLPERINHPAHGQPNTLVLQVYHEVRLRNAGFTWHHCRICLSTFEEGDYVYTCDLCSVPGCKFMMDIACSSIKAGVDYQDHRHPLFFLERINPNLPQFCCYCGEEMHELMFRCVECESYCLHLSCGPLPVTIPFSYSGHEMTLTLMDAVLDGVDPDDSWCDICEQQRDPMECVYRSQDPPFTATIDCVLPQIVEALHGELGELRLRRVTGHVPGVVLAVTQGSLKQELGEEKSKRDGSAEGLENSVYFTFDWKDIFTSNCGDVIDSLPQAEQELRQYAFTELEKIWSVEGMSSVMQFKFSDEAFKQFKEHAIIGTVKLSSLVSHYWWEEKPRFVQVGSNLVLSELVPLYRQLINKQGDFTSGCPLSQVGKAPYLMLLLMLIRGIQGLQICEMTADLLCTWQFYLEFMGEKLGFDIRFALDNLEQLARACYALKFVKYRDDIAMDLTQKIEQLERDIPEDRPKIETLKEQYRRAKESVFVKQLLAEASALKWKNAGEFMGMDREE